MAQDGEITTRSGAALQAGLLARQTYSAMTLAVQKYQNYRNKIVTTVEKRNQSAHQHIKKPPAFRYFIVLYVAIGLDIIGVVLFFIGLTGVGAVLEFLLSWILFTIPMMIFTRIMLGRRLKRMEKERKELEKDVEALQKAFTLVRQKFLRLSRYALKSSPRLTAAVTSSGARLSAASAKISRLSSRLTKGTARVQGLMKTAYSAKVRFIGESLPIIQLIPWWTLGVVFQYKEHKAEYEAGQATLARYQEVASNLIEAEDINFETQVVAYEEETDERIGELVALESYDTELGLNEEEETEGSAQPIPFKARAMHDIRPAVPVAA